MKSSKRKFTLYAYVVTLMTILFYASPASAFQYCFLAGDVVGMCTIALPENPAMELRARRVDTSAINFNVKASLTDTKRCSEAKGRLGKLKTGELLCVAKKEQADAAKTKGSGSIGGDVDVKKTKEKGVRIKEEGVK